MPIYEFRCNTCTHVFETYCRAASDVGQVVCDTCGGAVVRKFSVFRLGGFAPGPIEGDSTERTESKGGCSTCSTQSCSTCSVL